MKNNSQSIDSSESHNEAQQYDQIAKTQATTRQNMKNQYTRGGGAQGPPLLSRSRLVGTLVPRGREPPHYGNRPRQKIADKVWNKPWTPKGLFRRLAHPQDQTTKTGHKTNHKKNVTNYHTISQTRSATSQTSINHWNAQREVSRGHDGDVVGHQPRKIILREFLCVTDYAKLPKSPRKSFFEKNFARGVSGTVRRIFRGTFKRAL